MAKLHYKEKANDDVYVPYCEESSALYPVAVHTRMLDAFIVCMY